MTKRTIGGIKAGTPAIVANEIILLSADLAGVRTAHGGLLRLICVTTGITNPIFQQQVFQIGFHLVVGVLMSVFYGIALYPRVGDHPLKAGLLYGSIVWMINSAIVLPLIGEGFAGSKSLTVLGMMLFAIAHMLFFVLQSMLFGVFMRGQPRSLAGR
jgi:hypothetical protein